MSSALTKERRYGEKEGREKGGRKGAREGGRKKREVEGKGREKEKVKEFPWTGQWLRDSLGQTYMMR